MDKRLPEQRRLAKSKAQPLGQASQVRRQTHHA